MKALLTTVALIALSLCLACGESDRPSDSSRQPEASGDMSEAKGAPATPTSAPSGRPTSGRWSKLRAREPVDELTPEQREKIEELEAIGYLAGSRQAPVDKHVTVHDPDGAFQGFNFYTSGHGPEAVLTDMEGNELHRWRREFHETWPDYPVRGRKVNTLFWRRAWLFPNGDILAIHDGLGILKLDRDSNLIWATPNRAHHDLHVQPDGEIYVLTRQAHLVPRVNPQVPISEDFVSVLGPDGKERRRVSLLECFENSGAEHSWIEAARKFWGKERTRQLASDPEDIFHTNAIKVLDGSIAEHAPAFRKGNVLTSMCHLDMIAVVDLDQCAVVWSMGDEFTLQHDPRLDRDGRLMVFDNNWRRERSRVVVLDPATREQLWEYGMQDQHAFWSRTCGAAQPLPNGNVLITESDNGRAFEVTRDKRMVWEFLNPHRAGDNDEYIATLFDLVRLPAAFPVDWTHAATAKAGEGKR
jgi:hypothetical protein